MGVCENVALLEQGKGSLEFQPPNTYLCLTSTGFKTAEGQIEFDNYHGFQTGDRVRIVQATDDAGQPDGTMPSIGGTVAAETTDYFVIVPTPSDGKTIKLATSAGDATAGTAATIDNAGEGNDFHIAFQGLLPGRSRSITVTPDFGSYDATVIGGQPNYKGGSIARGTFSVTIQLANSPAANRMFGAGTQRGQDGKAKVKIVFDKVGDVVTADDPYVEFNAFFLAPTITNAATADSTSALETTVSGNIQGGWKSSNLYSEGII